MRRSSAKESAINSEIESASTVVPLDPRDDSQYAHFRDLNLEKVAWEFLRRNQDFRKECDGAEGKPEALQHVATKWKLYRFKHYALDFKEEKRPRFLPTLVRYFPNLTEEPLPRSITLAPGHVGFVLNAGALLQYQQAEEAQVKRLFRRLRRYLRDLAAKRTARPKQLQLKEYNYCECLQLLDLIAANVPPNEIKGLLPSLRRNKRSDSTEKSKANERLSKLRKQAKRLSEGGYLELAVVGAARRAELKNLGKAEKKTKELSKS